MPLQALVNEKKVKSWEFSNEQWKALVKSQKSKEAEIKMACCGVRAVLKSGSRVQHFAHKVRPEDCNWKPKSKEHIEIQYIIARACHNAGWEADIEVQGNGYIADVLAIKDDKSVAFEVQLSRQSLKDTMDRHQKFVDDDVTDVWLFKNLPATYQPRQHDVNIYNIWREDKEFFVSNSMDKRTLEEFVKYFLRYKTDSKKFSTRYNYEDNTPVLLPWWQEPLWILLLLIVFGTFMTWIYRLSQPKRKKRR